MSRVVADASVLLAMLKNESGIEALLVGELEIVAGTFNMTQVTTRLVAGGSSAGEAWRDTQRLVNEVVSFDEEQAKVASGLIATTKKYGLSLGDRACLALGLVLDLPVYTAAGAWKNVKAGVKIHLVR